MNIISEFCLLLAIFTLIIFFLLGVIWRKTKSLGFVVGFVFLYYWSLGGAWRTLNGYFCGGLETSLYKNLFFVDIDKTYLAAVALYALFIIVIETMVLSAIRPRRASLAVGKYSNIKVNSLSLLLISFFSLLLSWYLMRSPTQLALMYDKSVYYVLGKMDYEGKILYSLHLLSLYIASFSNVLAISLFCSGSKTNYMSTDRKKILFLLHCSMLIVLYLYTMSLGDRSLLLSTFTMGILIYLANASKPKMLLTIVLGCFSLGMIGVLSVIRGYAFSNLYSSVTFYDFLKGFLSIYTSNEILSAHYSLYGALKFEIPMTWGSSIISLFASTIPRIIWPSRPENLYFYYARNVGAAGGSGYSIHHATGWYLNFGIIGILVGAVLFGWLWAKLYNYTQSTECRVKKSLDIFKKIAFYIFVGYIPVFIRAGIEGYKSVIMAVFIIPILVLWASTIRIRIRAFN